MAEQNPEFYTNQRRNIVRGINALGKQVLTYPYMWHQADFDAIPGFYYTTPMRDEWNPLGMFGSAGLKWNPEEERLYIHDTYDFPWRVRALSPIEQRPREMKIRGSIHVPQNEK